MINSNGNKSKKCCIFLLLSLFIIKKYANELEEYTQKKYLEYRIFFEGYKILCFNYINILKCLLKMYKLDVLVELTGNVKIVIILDRSKLTKQLFHVIVDLKIIHIHS